MHLRQLLAATLFYVALAAAPAWAGPPLLCHPHDIGSQHSLPWLTTNGWNGADPNYDVAHLQSDVLAVLTPSAPVDVRMETIRRAVIYAAHQSGLSDQLAVALLGVVNAQTLGPVDPSAWFDAGYYVETLNEAARVYPNLRAVEHVDGVSWMREAIRLGGTGMQPAVAEVERAVKGI